MMLAINLSGFLFVWIPLQEGILGRGLVKKLRECVEAQDSPQSIWMVLTPGGCLCLFSGGKNVATPRSKKEDMSCAYT